MALVSDGLTLSRSIARNTVIQIFGRGGALLLSLAALMLLTRHLGVEGTGHYLLVSSLITLLNISDMGLLLITVRELSAGEEDANELLGNVIVLRIVTGLASIALVVGVTLSLGYDHEVTVAVLIGSLSYLGIAVGSGSLGAALMANLRMEYQVLANFAQSVVFIIGVIVVIVLDMGIIALFMAYNAGVLANTLIVIYYSRRFVRPRPRFDLDVWKRIGIASIPAGINTIAWLLYSRIDMVLLSKLKHAEAIGLYGLCYRFVDMSWLIGFFFVSSVYPVLSRYHRDGDHERLKWLMQRSIDIMALVALVPVTILFVFAEPILKIVGTQDFTAASTTLRILSLAILPMWIGMLCTYVVLAIGKQMYLLWTGILALAVNVSINLALIPSLSHKAAAIATVATEMTALSLMAAVIAVSLKALPSFRLAARVAAPIVAASAVAIVFFDDATLIQIPIVAAGMVIGYGFSGVISPKHIRDWLLTDTITLPARLRANGEQLRVLQVNRYFSNRGGAETVLFQTMGLLERHGHEVIPFSMHDKDNVASEYSGHFTGGMNLKRKASPLLALDPRRWSQGGRVIYSGEARDKMDSLIQETQPDVAHLHSIYHQLSPSILRPLHRQGVPTVLTLHDYKIVCPAATLFTDGAICQRCTGHKYFNAVAKGCVHDSRLKSVVCAAESYLHNAWGVYDKYVDIYAAPSQFMKDKMTELGLDGDRIIHLPNPINIDQYKPGNCEGSYIMFAGRLEETKGVDTLLEAVAASDVARGVELRIAGEGSKRKELEQLAQDRGLTNVKFLGWLDQDELAELHQKAMFAVVPSRWFEVFGLATIEAHAYAKPVIGANIGGIPELIREGKTGLLFEPSNVEDLRAKIEYLLADPAKAAQMGRCARAVLTKQYSDETQYRKLMEVYDTARETRDARLRLQENGKGEQE